MKKTELRILCMLLLTAIASAQAHRGTLTGTVMEPHGAVVPSAQISIRNPETGSQYETVTTTKDGQGNLTNGFGYINPLSSGTPRNGQVVIRFQF